MTEEWTEKLQGLEKENNRLIKKLDEYKQMYYELQSKKKIVASRTDTGLHPSGSVKGNALVSQNSWILKFQNIYSRLKKLLSEDLVKVILEWNLTQLFNNHKLDQDETETVRQWW